MGIFSMGIWHWKAPDWHDFTIILTNIPSPWLKKILEFDTLKTRFYNHTNKDFLARIFWPECLTLLARKSTSLARKSTSVAKMSTPKFEVDFLAMIFWLESLPQIWGRLSDQWCRVSGQRGRVSGQRGRVSGQWGKFLASEVDFLARKSWLESQPHFST